MEMNAYECKEVRGECWVAYFTMLHLIPISYSLSINTELGKLSTSKPQWWSSCLSDPPVSAHYSAGAKEGALITLIFLYEF